MFETVLLGQAVVEQLAVIVAAIADRREAIILAALDLIELVAAARLVLDDPEILRAGLEDHALRVANAHCIDSGVGGLIGEERIAPRRRAVRVDAQHLAVRALERARADIRRENVSRDHKERSVLCLHDAAGDHRAFLLEHVKVGDRLLIGGEFGLRDVAGVAAASWSRDVGEIDRAVLCKILVEDHVVHAEQRDGRFDVGRAGEGFRHLAIRVDDAQARAANGDDDVAGRQESEAPGVGQASRHRFDAELLGRGEARRAGLVRHERGGAVVVGRVARNAALLKAELVFLVRLRELFRRGLGRSLAESGRDEAGAGGQCEEQSFHVPVPSDVVAGRTLHRNSRSLQRAALQ